MNHLDEGTIHAWLDGASDSAQSAEIGAHVKACAECAAKVAEARGLIAASSRILTALDDVPANVTPKKTAAPVRRRRSITPWVSGLAAAVVLVTLWRAGGVEQPAPFQEITIPDIPAPSIPQPSLSDALKAPAPVASVPVASAPVASASQAKAGRTAGGVLRGAPASDLAGPTTANAAAVVQRDSASSAPQRAATDEASRSVRPIPASSVPRVGEAKDDFPLRLAGCYRLPDENSATEAVTAAVGAAASVARVRARAPASARSPSAQVAPRETQVALVRLDTTATADGFALIDPNTGSVRGVWSPINSDSARVRLPASGTVTFAINQKVRCPER